MSSRCPYVSIIPNLEGSLSFLGVGDAWETASLEPSLLDDELRDTSSTFDFGLSFGGPGRDGISTLFRFSCVIVESRGR